MTETARGNRGTQRPRAAARPAAQRRQRQIQTWSEQVDRTLPWLDDHGTELTDTGSRHGSRSVLSQLVIAQAGLARAIDHPTSERPNPFTDFAAHSFSSRDVELRAELAENESVASLISQLRLATAELTDRLAAPDLPDAVQGARAPVLLADLLRLGVIEWVVAAGDLSRAAPTAPPVPVSRAAAADAVRGLTEILADRYPGRSIEVRVPPHAAVQIGLDPADGPTHTRGTPPNVVETDPETFVRIATGRDTFTAARTAHRVRASGTRSDLTEAFPLI
ncbi:hypothetical protein GGQ54_002537 [Naumannella cuiyingiana]|uniref:Bacterial SCP orthologue domain-containing protein n=1 Tax=Naumannella cuiyingiana TaxID=1347891 RepID=A0A7Z0ILX8_9ACTN|nr:hypothetical protein [Naumannella cuiyingiana]